MEPIVSKENLVYPGFTKFKDLLEANLDFITRNLRPDVGLDWVHANFGPEGSGKSRLGYYLCQYVDPSFSARRVAFDITDFNDLIKDKSAEGFLRPGKAIMLDEAGDLFYSRESMSRQNRELNKTFMTIRQRGLFFVFNIPDFLDIDRGLRRRVRSGILTRLELVKEKEGSCLRQGKFWFYSQKGLAGIRRSRITGQTVYPRPSFKGMVKKSVVSNSDWDAYLERKIAFLKDRKLID